MPESVRGGTPADSFSLIGQSFLLWSEAEKGYAPETIEKRQDCLRQVVRMVGEKAATAFGKDDLLHLKRDMLRRKLSVSRQRHILYTLKAFLEYCRDEEGLNVFTPEDISFP